MATIWKKIPGLPGYEASSDGRIKVLETGHITKGGDAGRYLKVEVAKGNERTMEYVHHLIAKTFHGNIPKGIVVMHKDDNTKNNHKDNLKYGTQSDNVQQAYDRGRVPGKKSLESYGIDEILYELNLACEDITTFSNTLEDLDYVNQELDVVETSIVQPMYNGQLPDDQVIVVSDSIINGIAKKWGVLTVSNESVGYSTSLENLSNIRSTAKRLADQAAKGLKEAWTKLIKWFVEYRKKVKERCDVLKDRLVEIKQSSMETTTVEKLVNVSRSFKEKITNATKLIRSSGKEPNDELISGMEDIAKEMSEQIKTTSDDYSAVGEVPDGVDGAKLTNVVNSVIDVDRVISDLTTASNNIMSSIQNYIKRSEKDDNGEDKGPDKAKQKMSNKLTKSIQSIIRSNTNHTEKTLSAVNKSLKPVKEEN